MQGLPQCVYVEVLESKVKEAKSIPLHLEHLTQLESLIADARSWSDRTAKIFLKKRSTMSLLEVCDTVRIIKV